MLKVISMLSNNNKFNKTYKMILEGIFEPALDEEVAQRKKDAPKIMLQEWLEEFYKRKEIDKQKDGSYDVHGDVDLSNMELQEIPLKFNIVYGFFLCRDNEDLTSLEGCPDTVHFDFITDNCNLSDLVGGPRVVLGSYSCDWNPLTSLKGIAKTIRRDFSATQLNGGIPIPGGIKITKKYVRKMSNVHKKVYVDENEPLKKVII